MAGDEADGPVEFDAWLAGRSAALTRFAYVLTGSEQAAERALTAALTVACATWSCVRRSDDPEAHVQRLVVEAHLSRGGLLRRRRRPLFAVPTQRTNDRPAADDDASQAWRLCATLPPPQRAAVVLRCYAEMTYPQIAVAMGGKESAGQTHVAESFAALRFAIGKPRRDDALEEAFREAFAEHAEDPVDPGDRAPLAQAGARQRRRRQIVPAAAVATLIVGCLAGVAISYDAGGRSASKPEAGAHPGGWRAESFNGVQLWVPSSWGWGEVPRHTTNGLVSCGFGAYSSTALITNLRYIVKDAGSAPYVGRPVATGMACPAPPPTTAAHVWFDSPLPVGSSRAQTTVRVTGLSTFNVTVADANLTERRTILASIQQVKIDAHGCPRDDMGVRRIAARSQGESTPGPLEALSVCVYTSDASGSEALSYSTRLQGAEAFSAVARIEAGPSPQAADACVLGGAPTRTILIARVAKSLAVFNVYPGRCSDGAVRYVTGPNVHVLTRESEPVWGTDGLPVYARTE